MLLAYRHSVMLVVMCLFLWGNLLPSSSLSEREQHLLSSWSFQSYVYEKEQKHEKMADGVEKKVCLSFQTRQNTIKTEFKCLALHTQSHKNKTKKQQQQTCKQMLHFLGLPGLLLLLDVAGCLLSFYMGPFSIVEPVRKQTRVACFQLVIILFIWKGSFKKRRLMRNYGLRWHRQTHVNRFYIFLAYRGFWFCLMWLVASWVFIWDPFPLLNLSECKQELDAFS